MDDPWQQLTADRERARAEKDPGADLGYLATASCAGQPSVRTLVLRGTGERSIDLFCSRSGAKWLDLEANPSYELLIYWPSCRRQYRVRGRWHEIPEAERHASWHAQPHLSRVLDWYYSEGRPQGATLPSRQTLLDEVSALALQHPDDPNLEPAPLATGLRLTSDWVEILDLCGPDRLHDRRLYRWAENGWSAETLVP